MKKTFLYAAIILLLISALLSILLKYKFQNDFSLHQSEKLNSLMINIDASNPEQKTEIQKIANDYKYHIYTYNILAFITFAGSLLLFFKRKKILNEHN